MPTTRALPVAVMERSKGGGWTIPTPPTPHPNPKVARSVLVGTVSSAPSHGLPPTRTDPYGDHEEGHPCERLFYDPDEDIFPITRTDFGLGMEPPAGAVQ